MIQHPSAGLPVTEIAKVVNAALVEYDGDDPWGQLTEHEQAIIEHGVRVIQEGNDEPELCRQVLLAEGDDSGAVAEDVWKALKPVERRRWYLFAAIVRALSLSNELAV